MTNDSSSGSSKSGDNDNHSLFTKLGLKSYGTITFPRNYSSKANFIRIPPDASPAKVKELFFREDPHKRPSLVISVIGKARAFNMKSKLFRIFRHGFIKMAKTADIWIMTDAINTCVSKLMGKIIRTNPEPSHPIYLIGFERWECISGVEQLDVHGSNVVYAESTKDEQNRRPLEPNHTHFIFIDDQMKDQCGQILPFRGLFEKEILGESIELHTNDQSESLHFPIVLVVIKGGLNEIIRVHESVVKNRIPIVFLEGSGGCCDLFAKCYHLYNKYNSQLELYKQKKEYSSVLNKKHEEIKNKIRDKFQPFNKDFCHNSSNKNAEIDYFELIYECVETRNIFLNFIDLTIRSYIKPEIDLVILQSFFNITTGNDLSVMNIQQKREQLNLSFQWKRIDIVKNFIIHDDRDWKAFGLNDLFSKALIQNEISFVQLFLDYDFPLDELFDNNNKILSLYENENYKFKHHFDDPLRTIYHEIIQPLIGSSFQVDAIFNLHEIDVVKEIFLWSILTGKHQLALFFWARGKNKVCAALCAIVIYKNKARKEKDESYIEHADQFQNLAVQILKNFSEKCSPQCTKAIIRQIPQFGNLTWLHLAVMAEAKLFIAQRPVQNVLQSIWYGHIDYRVGHAKILLSSFMLWYSGFLPYHKELVERYEKYDKTDNYQAPSNHFVHRNPSQSKKTSDSASSKLMDQIINEEENSVIVVDNNPWKRIKSGVIQYVKNVSLFLHAPCVKYLYNLYFHVIFLMLFSYVILCDFFPLYDFERRSTIIKHNDGNVSLENENSKKENGFQKHKQQPTISEIILVVWVFTLFCEEIRQLTSKEVESMYEKIVTYFSVFWNQLDVLAIFLFFVAFILRWFPYSPCFSAARIVLAIDLSIWYIRTLDVFSAIKRLGPKLVMISEMIHDMKFYMTMITVFVLAYGVPAYSLLYGVQKLTWHIPRAVINLAYWPIFGELQALDDIEKNTEMSGYVVFILLILYMTVSSILLINLLIAMFSNTFDRLQLDTDCIWKFQYYSLVSYHLHRPSFPPPLVIFSHVYHLIIYVFSFIFKIRWFYEIYTHHENRSKFKIILDEMMTKKIEAIEDALGNDVYFCLLKRDRKNDSDDEQVHSPQDVVLNKITALENQQEHMLEYLEYLMNTIDKIGGDDIQMPKQSRQDS